MGRNCQGHARGLTSRREWPGQVIVQHCPPVAKLNLGRRAAAVIVEIDSDRRTGQRTPRKTKPRLRQRGQFLVFLILTVPSH